MPHSNGRRLAHRAPERRPVHEGLPDDRGAAAPAGPVGATVGVQRPVEPARLPVHADVQGVERRAPGGQGVSHDGARGVEEFPDALLGQLVGNLIRNAVVHNVSGGSLRVVLDDRSSELRVENDGEVIPADEAHELTEPFRRRHRTRTNGSGHGLGLPLVASLEELEPDRVQLAMELRDEVERLRAENVRVGVREEFGCAQDLENWASSVEPESASVELSPSAWSSASK